jgi:endogenous inhibitor of DNA gyrase (YacG/DUF329 family)
MNITKIFSLAAVAAALFTATAQAEAINDKCPVSGKAVKEGKVVEAKVGFCCEKCKGKFDAEPAKFLKKAAGAKEGMCPVSGKPVDEDQTSTVSIGVCCGKCESKVAEDPKKFLGDVEPK